MSIRPPHGYGPLYHSVLERLFYVSSGQAQTAVFLTVINCTEGEARGKGHVPPEWSAPISAEEFAKVGNCSIRSAERAVDDAIERGLLARMADRGNGRWRYKVIVAAFQTVADYEETRPEPLAEVPKVPPAKRHKLSDGPLVLMPRGNSRPIPLEAAIKEQLTGLQFHNDTPGEFAFDAFVGDDTMLHFWLRTAPETQKSNATPVSYFAPSSPTSPDLADTVTANLQALCQQIQEQINPLFNKHIGHDIDQAYVSQLAATIQEKNQTVDAYLKRAKKRLERAAQNGGVQSGLFGRIADDLQVIRIDPALADAEAEVREWERQRRLQ